MAKKAENKGTGDSGLGAGEIQNAAESQEWTPRDYAEFLSGDPEAVKVLFEALSKPPTIQFTEEQRAEFEQAMKDAPHGDLEVIRIAPPAMYAPRPTLLGPGQTCAWFEGADDSRTPLAALVIGNDGNDMVSLEIRYPDGTRREMHGVLHLYSQRFTDEPQHRRMGGWDWPDLAEARRAERAAKIAAAQQKQFLLRKDRQRKEKEMREAESDEMCRLIDCGMGFDEAVRKLGPHWTVEFAMTHYKRTGRALPRQTVA